jgi:hypothetical protein
MSRLIMSVAAMLYLIDCCLLLMSSGKYFMYIQNENKFNDISQLYSNDGGIMGQTQQRLLTCYIWLWTEVHIDYTGIRNISCYM